jgi:hypothetical protein
MADDGARGDPHRALELAGRSLGDEGGFRQRLLGGFDRFVEAERGSGRLEAVQGAVEKQHPQLLLQCFDVAAEGWLAVADLPPAGRQ